MKIETVRKNYWKGISLVSTSLIIVLVAFIINGVVTNNDVSESLIKGEVNYKTDDFDVLAMYQENDSGGYDEITEMPGSGYTINEDKSYCYTTTSSVHDSDAELKTVDGNHVFNNLDKNSKCYVWFDKAYTCNGSACETIMANKTVSERTSFNTVLTEDTTGTMYRAEDDDGTTYYFAGATTDNYVYFAGYYWRIIRVNGDGSVRLIYNGTSIETTGAGTQLASTSVYNVYANNNTYVGFMYTVGSLRGLGTDSTIKDSLDTWYTNNLASYSQHIDKDAGFCGDRTPSTSNSSINNNGGTSSTITYYAGYIRLYYQLYNQGSTTASPTFKCANSSDLYTVSTSTKGNKALTNPIGLISAEEVSYAGGLYGNSNTSYYLYTGNVYWTMSPNSFNGSNAYVFSVYTDGSLNTDGIVKSIYGVRPVINLKAEVTLTGSGTTSSPYKLS